MTKRKAITRVELAEVAAGLRRILDAIVAGELTAPSGTVNRLEGAWLAVEALASGRTLDPDALLGTLSIAADMSAVREHRPG